MKLKIGDTDVPLQEFSFPGGEVHVRMSRIPDIASREERITIEARLHDSGSLMSLLLLTDAVRRAYASHGDLPIHLVCPYLPYARQDRVAVDGEPLSIAVLAGILNAQRYATVEVWDAHSNVSLALIDRVVHRQAHVFAKSAVWIERSKSIAAA
ncbi:MAG: ribose-phosphate pyrophosphokinase-like domain-containing protein, partial [Janthinobacterium lividum]